MNKRFIKIIILLILVLAAVSVLLFVIYFKFLSRQEEPQDGNDVVGFPISQPISSSNISINTYTDPKGRFKYDYPSSWTFSTGRTGIGLYPLDNPLYKSGNHEILTIFAAEGTQTAEEYSKLYDGFGPNYNEGKNIKINGYDVYTFVFESSYRQLFYILAYNGVIIHISFREKDNSRGENVDNSKYTKDVEEIVNSIEFLSNNSLQVYNNKFLSDQIVPNSQFPINTGKYIKNNYNSFEYKVKDIPIEIALVNPDKFSDRDDLMKKFYMSLSGTGNFIESFDYITSAYTIRLALMEPAIGGKSYLLIGSIINDGKGYFFQTYIGDAGTYNISESSIGDIVNFNHNRNPVEVLNLLKSIVEEDIPNNYFNNFVQVIDRNFEILPKGNYDLPQSQDRN